MQMVLWFGLAVLSAAVVAVLLKPLLRQQSSLRDDADPTAIYRDQLRELDLERERGTISAPDFDAARTEIARRLLAAADARPDSAGSPQSNSKSTPRLAITIAAAVPLSAIAIYLAIGAPHVPSQPHAARLKAPLETARVDELVRAVEARLRQHPGDGQGWDVVGPVYLKQGRFREAADAFAAASRLLGETPKRLAGLAEATVLENDGIVTAAARIAYEKLTETGAGAAGATFWLAMAKEQDGRLAAAISDYDALIASAPDGAHGSRSRGERRDECTSDFRELALLHLPPKIRRSHQGPQQPILQMPIK